VARAGAAAGGTALAHRIELRLGLGFWAVTGVTALACGHAATVAWGQFVLPLVAVVAGWPLLRRTRHASFVLDWIPLPMVVLTYAMLHKVVPLCWEETIDPWLRDADRALFGAHVGTLLQPLVSRPLTLLMSAAYASYYVLPLSAGLWLYRRDRIGFRRLMAGEVGVLFIGYLGYLFLPALGPYVCVPELGAPLSGDFMGRFIRYMVEFRDGTFPRDAFPSLHTANAVTILLVGLSNHRRLAAVYLLPVLGLIAATMYLRFHYAVDVGAGIALAVAWQPVANRLVAREPSAGGAACELHSCD